MSRGLRTEIISFSMEITVMNMPKAIDLEEMVLGAAIIDKNGQDDLMNVIATENAFYDLRHRQIYLAIRDLYMQGDPVDLGTLSYRLRQRGQLEAAGGDFYIIQLSQKISSSAHMEIHCRILLQQMVRRMIIMFNANITAMAMDDTQDVFELMQRWTKEFDKISDLIRTGKRAVTIANALDVLGGKIQMLSAGNGETVITGLHTGFQKINEQTGGYQPGDLIILAARPGMGKTSKVLKTALENVKAGVPVGFISLEMSVHKLVARLVACDTDFHLKQLLKTGFAKDEYFITYAKHKMRIGKYPLYVDDSGESDITDIVVEARRMVRMYGVRMIIIDYLQLMGDRSKGNNREQEISTITRRLKKLAKELELPIIALSQLSRQVETRGSNKRPMLADLRESGAIEQDADIVEFIYRPGYYNLEMEDEKLIDYGADAEVIFAKYRDGSVFTIGLKWIADKTKYIDPRDPKEFERRAEDVPALNEHKPLPTPTAAEAFGEPGHSVNDLSDNGGVPF